MKKRSNFYLAIEEAIIRPAAEEMNGIEDSTIKLSEEYREKMKKLITGIAQQQTSDNEKKQDNR